MPVIFDGASGGRKTNNYVALDGQLSNMGSAISPTADASRRSTECIVRRAIWCGTRHSRAGQTTATVLCVGRSGQTRSLPRSGGSSRLTAQSCVRAGLDHLDGTPLIDLKPDNTTTAE
jgi:hypothetical protein